MNEYLRNIGGVGHDAKGNEVMLGLDLAESKEFLGLAEISPMTAAQRQRFIELSDRHEMARIQRVAWLNRKVQQ